MKRGQFVWRAMVIAVAALVFGVVTASAADPKVFDRGLPTSNLNNGAGASRSNVAWSNGNNYVSGDDFTIGASGETWSVTAIRAWAVVGGRLPGTFKIGDVFSDVSLYTGSSGIAVTATGTLTAGSDASSNPNITLTPVQYTGAIDYQATGGSARQIYQVDFTGLNLAIAGGVKYYFGVDGTPRNPTNDLWFNHASNAALSGSTQQGADNRWLVWLKTSLASTPTTCDSNGPISGVCNGGWDKSSDINVQVFAHKQLVTPGSVGGTTDLMTHGGSGVKATAGRAGVTGSTATDELAVLGVATTLVLAGGWYVRRRWSARS